MRCNEPQISKGANLSQRFLSAVFLRKFINFIIKHGQIAP